MKCRNCGNKNDADGQYCEKCGAKLTASRMPTSTMILIIGVIVLVAGLGLVSGMMLMNNQAKTIPINTSQENNSVGNSSSTPNTTQNTNGVTMSPEEAMQIVNNELSGYYKATSAVLENRSPNPVYNVHIIHITPNDYGKDGGYVTVDTVTRFVDHKGV